MHVVYGWRSPNLVLFAIFPALWVSSGSSCLSQRESEMHQHEGHHHLLPPIPDVGENIGSHIRDPVKTGIPILTCFRASFFPFCPLWWPPLFLPFSRHLVTLFSPSKSALFCRAKGTAQSLERGGLRMDLSKKFGKEIPSRNLREKRSAQKNRAFHYQKMAVPLQEERGKGDTQ